MKTLFGFNLIIYVITTLLFIEPITGAIAMFFLGALNVIQSIVMLVLIKRLSPDVRVNFLIYFTLVLAWLATIFSGAIEMSFGFFDHVNGIVISMILGLYFLVINFLMMKEEKNTI